MSNLTLPLTGVSGAGAVGTSIPDVNGGTTAKALLGNAGVGALGSVGATVSVALTSVSAIGRVGASPQVEKQPFVQALGLSFPQPVFALAGTTGTTGDLAFTTPTAALALTALVSGGGALSLAPPTLALQLAGVAGALGSLALALPLAGFSFGDGASLRLRLPPPALALTGTAGLSGALKLNLPLGSLQLAGVAEVAAAVVLPFPVLRMAVAGTSGAAAALQLVLRALALQLTGTSGTIGTLALPLPIVRLDVAGYGPASGSMLLLLPIARLQLAGGAALAQAGATTLVMQTERGALTQYTNYPFNSFAAFNGVFLGASDVGVFALSGDTDAGVAIAAAARGGTTDFGTSHIKRVERIYVGYRSTGRMILRVVTDENATRDYALAPANNPGLHGAHVKLGRGVEARYWQFEWRNDAGADFSIDMTEMKPIKLKRRAGGGRA